MSPIDMLFMFGIILGVIKIVQFWIYWEFVRRNEYGDDTQ